jgi:ABC-2 type transport system permease protein
MLTTILYSASSRIREQQMNGTLEYTLNLLRWPCEMPALSMASDFLAGVLRLYLLLIAAELLFDFPLGTLGAVNFLFPIMICAIAFGAVGNLAAASVLLFKRGEPITYFVGTASALFGTVFFPREVLPSALQRVSDLIPTTHALAVLRGSILEGKGMAELGRSYLFLLAFSAVLVPLSLWLFNAAVRRAKWDGSLGQY